MMPSKSAGRIVGGLMLLHLALGLIGPYVVLVPISAPPGGFLENAAPAASAIRASVLVLMIGALIPVLLVTMLAPVAWTSSRSLSLWLVIAAGVNLALQMVENAHWLTMMSVSQGYQDIGGGSDTAYVAVGVAVRSAFKWSHYSHIFVLVAWLALFFVTLFRCNLVPRWLAAAGGLTAGLHFAGITLPEFAGYRLPSGAMWGIPLAIVCAATASWLLFRGFPGLPLRERTTDS